MHLKIDNLPTDDLLISICQDDLAHSIAALISNFRTYGSPAVLKKQETGFEVLNRNDLSVDLIQSLHAIINHANNGVSKQELSADDCLIFKLADFGYLCIFESVRLSVNLNLKLQKVCMLIGNHLQSISVKTKANLYTQKDVNELNQQFRQRERMFRYMIRHMNLGLIEFNTENIIEYANMQFSQISGYSLDKLIGHDMNQFPFAKWQSLEKIEDNNFEKNLLNNNYEISFLNHKQEKRFWLISGAQNFNEKKELLGTIGIVLDITNQKKLELELKESKEIAESSLAAESQFLANLSHEIRNPLNIITGLIYALQYESEKELIDDYLQKAKKSADYLLSLLNNVLDMSKIEKGAIELMKNPFNLSHLLHDVVNYFELEFNKKGISLNLNSDLTHDVFEGDESRIKQVLYNLIGNALKFTEKGAVNLHVFAIQFPDDDSKYNVVLQIVDTGIGISKDYLKNIFKVFSHESKSSSLKYGGVGLGLSISHRLIELMNGSISIESEKNFGTKVKVTLPLDKSNHNFIASNNLFVVEKLKDKSVLVVDDIEMNRRLLQKMLERNGLHVETAKNGLDAIDKVKNHSFDIILMDIQMPEMEGTDAVKFIRNQLSIYTPVIAVTANAFKDDIKQYLAAGMQDVIIKPYDEQIILKAITKQLKSKPTQEIHQQEEFESYNLEKLKVMCEGDESFMMEMLMLFVDITQQNLLELKQCVDKQDYTQMSKVAHRMKQSVANLGLERAKSQIIALEFAAKQNHPDEEQILALIQFIEISLQNAINTIRKDFQI